MAHAYYKILSLNGKMCFSKKISDEESAEIAKDKKIIKYKEIKENGVKKGTEKIVLEIVDTIETKKTSKEFHHVLKQSMETEQLLKLCKKNHMTHLIPPKKSKNELFLGYFDALINVNLTYKELRSYLYEHGFTCNGKKYVRYKRSASAAKSGSCLFILEDLYADMENWSNCGITETEDIPKAQLVSMEAYKALTMSEMQSSFSVPKKSILLIRDQESVFQTSGMNVTADEKGYLTTDYSDSIPVKNKIWDGECLIDESVFEDVLEENMKDKHMLLLRNRFFKSCGFRTRLQKWFQDNGVTSVSELNGVTLAKDVADIKIVITESSLKYLKFYDGETDSKRGLKKAFTSWLNEVKCGTKITFGIVKTDVPSRYGNMVQTNYQLLNTLGLNEEESKDLIKPFQENWKEIQSDPKKFLEYLNRKAFLSDEEDEQEESQPNNPTAEDMYFYKEALARQLLSYSDEFFYAPFCRDILYRQNEKIKDQVQQGRFLIPGTYATLFGNPIEFLCATLKDYQIPQKPEPVCVNGKQYAALSENEIVCTMFENGSELCGARSPHITMGNLFLAKNTSNAFIEEYFTLSDSIVCVNSIHHNLMERLNGADFDSDIMLLTNQPVIVEAVKRQRFIDKHGQEREFFPVPMLRLNDTVQKQEKGLAKENEQQKETEACTRADRLAEIDHTLQNNLIGSIVNLSQLLNSILWTRFPNLCRFGQNEKDWFSYNCDYLYSFICELEVLSNLEIDNAKRENGLDTNRIWDRIRKEVKVYEMRRDKDGWGLEVTPNYFKTMIQKEESSYDPKIGQTIKLKFPTDEDDISKDKNTEEKNVLYLKAVSADEHNSTMRYVSEIATPFFRMNEKKRKKAYTSLVKKVDGKRTQMHVYNEIKAIAAYYYLSYRTASYISKDG
ncbi:MAG: hypothetical protein ACI4HI_00470, partial [Lachnospiraceae bacterium]